ncbi:ATPase [Methanobrevibacter woesei]|uniref:ATPase n=1 Tax=Methanobrevibacter woesei TaxID=190976 RepID=UPI0026DF9B5E|nr:ATPase [Methanobrevibacter woesei]
MYSKELLLFEINEIRKEIGHESVDIQIYDIIYNEKTKELWIITEDRPDKAAIIGKGGWVVGKLREKLKVESIHVENYANYLQKEYQLKLAGKTLTKFQDKSQALSNLKKVLDEKLNHIYNFSINEYMKNSEFEECEKPQAVVALSGGVDSSLDAGTIILPNQFKHNIKDLCELLDVKHHYINADYSEIIAESLNGKFHPCGKCSKKTEELIYDYAEKNNLEFVIYGDMLSTGTQCITKQRENIYRINLPASLSTSKQEIKSVTRDYELREFDGFGCPLLYEVHRKFPYHKKFSIQRILRETRASALEVGEALDLIWSFYKTK